MIFKKDRSNRTYSIRFLWKNASIGSDNLPPSLNGMDHHNIFPVNLAKNL